MKNKFNIIVADPPYSFEDKLQQSAVKRGASANYRTMTISDIQQLPVKDIISPDGAILALWVPSSLLQEGLDTMKAWGFRHKQTYIWVKTKKDSFKEIRKIFFDMWEIYDPFKDKITPRKFIQKMKKSFKLITDNKSVKDILSFGMGRLFRQTHEICLIGTSDNKIYKQLNNKSQRSVSFAANLKHSAKPENLQNSLEIMFPTADKIELFARRIRSDWTCLGNQIDGQDIRDALLEL